MKKWKILNRKQVANNKRQVGEIIKILLENRGIKTKKEVEEFLNPELGSVTVENVGIDKKQLNKAISRIKIAIKNKEKIVVFGDYDVDGICGTAILWETLDSLGANVMPYIPHRIDEGYGLSIRGIEKIKNQKSKIKDAGLIITVDNGIVANDAVRFANEEKIDVIITDHHVPSRNLPKALAIIHTTRLCGAGVAWLLGQEIRNPKSSSTSLRAGEIRNDHLGLVALATVADLVPLKGFNRTLLKFGLEQLRKTKRIGLLELFKEAEIGKQNLGVYEIGHIIAPRLNAMGRLEYAMDSLRLVCARNQKKAENLAKVLGSTNKERQSLTLESTLHAIEQVKSQKSKVESLLFIAHERYEQGVIGLIAGKLVEEFYKPAIVISVGKKFSKASARSIRGFDMIEFIRSASEFLIDAGGHPMAAGFTIETEKIPLLQKTLEDRAETLLDKDLLTRILRIDCELTLSDININFYENIQKLAPFGMGNPEPVFVSKNVLIEDMRLVGAEGKHIKLKIKSQKSKAESAEIQGIGFGMGEKSRNLHIGDKINIVYTVEKDDWNNNERLQLKIKDMI